MSPSELLRIKMKNGKITLTGYLYTSRDPKSKIKLHKLKTK